MKRKNGYLARPKNFSSTREEGKQIRREKNRGKCGAAKELLRVALVRRFRNLSIAE